MAVVEKSEHREDLNPGRPLRWVEIVQGGVVGLVIILLVVVTLFIYRGSEIVAFQGTASPDVIVLIVADTLRADRLSCYGYTKNQTPHIDALARDGVLYRYMNTQASWTKPSVATILTSLYPSTHRTLHKTDLLPDEVLTLAEILSVQGYHTAGFVTNINLFPELNFHQGFETYYDLGVNMSRQILDGQKYYQEAELVNGHVLAWLEAEHRKPGATRFFMYIHYMDPHWPYFEHPYNGKGYNPPADRSQVQLLSDAHDGEIAYLDKHLGDVFAALKRLGLYDDALIVFTADHGEEFYEHQGWSHGWTLYEEITAVPLIIKYPGNVRHPRNIVGKRAAGNVGAGTVDEGLARSLDIAPTILDVAGIEPPVAMRGVSLRLPPDSPARAQFSVAETSWTTQVMAVRTPRYKLIEVVDGDVLRGRAPTQLYDLAADPGEQTNLATARPDIVARLRADMSHTLALAERSAVGGQEGDFDPAFLERLGRLGY